MDTGSEQRALQSRLDQVFGQLSRGQEQPSWQPTTQPVFRVGAPITDQGDSSDEEDEYKERARREVVPGLAMDLATEDEPDAEGFMPSTAFCRALDREEEYNDVDELATGTYKGRPADARPPRGTEVLDDNVWEQRIAQHEALEHSRGEPPAAMETDAQPAEGDAEAAHAARGSQQQQQEEGGGAAAEVPAAEQQCRGRSSSSSLSEGVEALGTSPRSALASGARAKGMLPKRVRFEGVPQPWVPPHRREGFVPRDPDHVPPSEPAGPRPQRGIAQSVVPDHVKHPERYTLYTLDEPLVVGGGLGQLGAESQAQLQQQAVSALGRGDEGGAAVAGEPEPERWQGAVGGGIQFRPRAAKPGPKAAADADLGGGQTKAAVRLSVVDAEGEDCEAGGDATMADAAAAEAQQEAAPAAGGFKLVRARTGRYRSKAPAEEEGEEEDG